MASLEGGHSPPYMLTTGGSTLIAPCSSQQHHSPHFGQRHSWAATPHMCGHPLWRALWPISNALASLCLMGYVHIKSKWGSQSQITIFRIGLLASAVYVHLLPRVIYFLSYQVPAWMPGWRLIHDNLFCGLRLGLNLHSKEFLFSSGLWGMDRSVMVMSRADSLRLCQRNPRSFLHHSVLSIAWGGTPPCPFQLQMSDLWLPSCYPFLALELNKTDFWERCYSSPDYIPLLGPSCYLGLAEHLNGTDESIVMMLLWSTQLLSNLSKCWNTRTSWFLWWNNTAY